MIANLRPPNPNPTKETGGRKSNKRVTRIRAAKLREDVLASNDEPLLDPQDELLGRGLPEEGPQKSTGLSQSHAGCGSSGCEASSSYKRHHLTEEQLYSDM